MGTQCFHTRTRWSKRSIPASCKGVKPESYHFMIFDRWGTLIFESFDIGEPWIGDIRGGKGFAQDGTYVWRLEVQPLADRSLKVFTGFVLVLR